jgi:transcriptional regulator with GAF, ATPase, and Fis domain
LGRTALRDVSLALADLHAVGVAHGDIKPSNVIAARSEAGEWQCGLIDLGLAEAANSAVPRGATLRYLPPEFQSGAPSDGRSRDLWALGLTLLEWLVPEARQTDEPRRLLDQLPRDLHALVGGLLEKNPAARPAASWINTQVSDNTHDPERSRLRIEQSYVALRAPQLMKVARGFRFAIDTDGVAATWLEERCRQLAKVARLRGIKELDSSVHFGALERDERRLWLARLIGVTGLQFAELPSISDAQLLGRLLEQAEHFPPEAFSFRTLFGANPAAKSGPLEDVDLALQLGAENPSEQTVLEAERRALAGESSPSFCVHLSRILKRRNAMARALTVLGNTQGAPARLEEAHVKVRLGDRQEAEALLGPLLESEELTLRDNARALAARLAQDQGDPKRAEQLLAAPGTSFRFLEARALVELQRGPSAVARKALELALQAAESLEDKARAQAALAHWSQLADEPRQAFDWFGKAAEHAERAGALLEEATYLIGVASTGANLGRLSDAIAASDRANLLFEYLGRRDAAARAALAKANALLATGALAEAHGAALQALHCSKSSGDRRCEAFAHLALCDSTKSTQAHDHLERAELLLGRSQPEDALFVAARRLSLGELDDLEPWDRRASRDVGAEARTEWWGTRARVALANSDLESSAAILTELVSLTHSDAPVSARGPAFSYGAQLAARLGDGDSARRLAEAGYAAFKQLHAGLDANRRAALAQLEWVTQLTPGQSGSVAPGQLGDIETLIHSLAERQNLRALLDRILDALIRWTSVERGLLLLRAPGGGLKPRAARNLARKDLVDDQLKLSTSLAEQALATRECVIAVDAAGELPSAHASVHALKLRSVLAVPLIARGEVLGVAYLDDRMRAGAFGKRELAWVRLVSTLAAVAVADARDQLLLRRAVRKARYAEARVTQVLAKREAALMVANQALARARARQTRFDYDAIVGQSAPIQELLRLVDRVVPADVPVLVLGPSGSGKELIARAIHRNGPRSEAAFVSENCSAIPETLLESTLFGHVKGAFTGASRHHAGLFEVAHGGTLFLDEIADTSLAMQAKLLRCLENGEIRRVGSEQVIHVDVRVIAATHKDLERMVRERQFREDLYYRLNVIRLHVPALSERRDDIPLLVRHFLLKYGAKRQVTLGDGVLEELCSQAWPGNVRQLENEVRRALVLADDEIRLEHLSSAIGSPSSAPVPTLNLRQRLDALEAQLVKKALIETHGNQTKASQLLGVSRFGLQKMIRRLGVEFDPPTSADD